MHTCPSSPDQRTLPSVLFWTSDTVHFHIFSNYAVLAGFFSCTISILCEREFKLIETVQQHGGFMALWKIHEWNRLKSLPFVVMAATIALLTCPKASTQSLGDSRTCSPTISSALSGESSSLSASGWRETDATSADPAQPLAVSPQPASPEFHDKWDVAPSATAYQRPFSRVGIGADVSPLGIGFKTAVILDHVFDARLMGNYFNYNVAQFEVEGFKADADFHLASAAALDWYPFASIWRISPGMLFLNGNQASGGIVITPGTSFSLNNQTFFSATANAATGATPLAGAGALAFHTHSPAFTITGGFGKFIPRSDRHWSFPAEFGVAFTGAPKANANFTGWVCTGNATNGCNNVGDTTTPAGAQFNSALQTQLTKWNRDLAKVSIYPLFSYSVMYSFTVRH